MALTHGNDPEALDAIGDALGVEAERARSALSAGTVGLTVLVESWSGQDVESFDSGWRVAERQLDAAAQMLRTAGERAREQAEEQRAASSGEGGGSSASRALPSVDGDPASASPVMHDHDVGGGGPPALEDLPVPYPPGAGNPSEEEGARPWTPQGFAVTDDGTYAVTTFYDQDDPDSGMLAIQPLDGGPVKYVPIEGNDHFGGVAIEGDNVYVSGNGETESFWEKEMMGTDGSFVQRYSLEELQTSPDGQTVHPDDGDVFKVPVASTITVHEDSLYVGRFSQGSAEEDPPRVYEYRLDDDGSLPVNGTTAADQFAAPEGMQGMTTEDGVNFFFTSSNGFDENSELIHVNRYDEDITVVRSDLSPVSQGIARIDGQFVITNESAAEGGEGYDEKVKAGGFTPEEHLQVFDAPFWPGLEPPPRSEFGAPYGL